MATKETRTVLEARIGSLAESDVVLESIDGREALSTPYTFTLRFRPSGDDPLALADLLGARTELLIRRPDGEERKIHGVLREVSLEGVRAGHPHYRALLVPRLALLDQALDSRIFQNKSVPEVVKEVLDAHEVKLRSPLSASYAKREYCVQARETDLAFVSRLLEEEGIFYFFEHGDEGEKLVLADAVNTCQEIPGDSSVPFRDAREARDEQEAEHVSVVRRGLVRRPGKLTLRDFDFTKPDLDLTASQQAKTDTAVEVYEYPGGYTGPLVGARLAKARLEALSVARQNFEGESTCLRLSAGARFTVAEHPDDAFNQSLLLLEVQHQARQESRAGAAGALQSGYRNRFVAALDGVPFRPERRTPRPKLFGPQTAVAVAAGGEEVHPDAHGRIKVKFPWDRSGRSGDQTSCFVRLAQRWAGPGMGTSVVPRAGQEVVVTFLEGNPDRPLIVGAVFNGSNAVPISLPGDRTQAVFRTDSSPGGGGQNELLLEDAAGSERVYLHAQKNQTIAVTRDKRQQIKANESLDVGANRTRHVGKDQRLRVTDDDDSTVKKNQTVQVNGNQVATVGGEEMLSVAKALSVSVGAAQSRIVKEESAETVGAAAALTIGGGYAVTVAGVHNVAVGGVLSRQVGGAYVEMIAGPREETVGKSVQRTIGGDLLEQTKTEFIVKVGKALEESISGKAELEAKKPMMIVAKSIELETDTLSLVVGGQLAWEMKSGDVTAAAKTFTLEGSSDVVLKGGKIKKEAGDSAASKSVDITQLEDLKASSASVKIGAKAASGAPLANMRFKAEMPDGSTVSGKTDGAGNAAIPASKDGEVKLSFPDLDADAWKTG